MRFCKQNNNRRGEESFDYYETNEQGEIKPVPVSSLPGPVDNIPACRRSHAWYQWAPFLFMFQVGKLGRCLLPSPFGIMSNIAAPGSPLPLAQ